MATTPVLNKSTILLLLASFLSIAIILGTVGCKAYLETREARQEDVLITALEEEVDERLGIEDEDIAIALAPDDEEPIVVVEEETVVEEMDVVDEIDKPQNRYSFSVILSDGERDRWEVILEARGDGGFVFNGTIRTIE